ncbi:sulfatase-like hydrolase/transferase [Lutibacter citreus]|uniref:sulfatase-like hydrolase/transferase n=1 Tax=Lutibacter citreus TaxID=2138210 RepID=UPI000DBEA3C2|nr:sulfatase-like hydrolase/transferase [Lutibacter citreus]
MRYFKLFFLVLAIFFSSAKTIFAQQKPNVLWILTDDHRYDAVRTFNKMLHGREMSELGYVESPNIDRLASMGTTFVNSYCQAQGCAPSRASMHYGRYPFRSGVYEFEYHNNNTNNSYPHLPAQMEKLGYQTVHVGKLGVRLRTVENGKAVKPQIYQTDIDGRILTDEGMTGWGKLSNVTELNGQKLVKKIKQVEFLKIDNDKVYYISKQLEDENAQFFGMAKEASDKLNLLRKYGTKEPNYFFTPGILAGVSPREDGKTRDGAITSSFISFLKNENKSFKIGNTAFNGVDASKPLFCHIGFNFPHTPVLPPSNYRDRFHKHTYKVPELTDKEWETMPSQLKRQVKGSFSNNFTNEQKQRMIQDYYAFCAYGDNLVGQSADAFIAYSEKNSQPWMIVYVNGDHGWKLNEHGAYSKFTPWEIDSHNPIIVVSSNQKLFPAGKVVKNYTEFVDIAPTIIAAAGADINLEDYKYLDGLDLAKVTSKKAPQRDYVIGESHAVTGPRAFIRTKEYVFSMQTRPNKKRGVNMEWALHANYKDLDPALYHVSKDPHEINNLAFDKNYKNVVKAMKEKLTNIVLGDNRAEIDWGKGTRSTGTVVKRSNFSPGAHDYKLKIE